MAVDPLPADAFDVVIPSLPSYGFSSKPSVIGWAPSASPEPGQCWSVGYDPLRRPRRRLGHARAGPVRHRDQRPSRVTVLSAFPAMVSESCGRAPCSPATWTGQRFYGVLAQIEALRSNCSRSAASRQRAPQTGAPGAHTVTIASVAAGQSATLLERRDSWGSRHRRRGRGGGQEVGDVAGYGSGVLENEQVPAAGHDVEGGVGDEVRQDAAVDHGHDRVVVAG